MNTFIPVNDTVLAKRIEEARSRLVFVAPAVSEKVVEALGYYIENGDPASVTLVIDCDDTVYRLGYGDQKGLTLLQDLADNHNLKLRLQRGLRIGILITDDNTLVWSPTPQFVEGQRGDQEPNGLVLTEESENQDDTEATSLSAKLFDAIGSDDDTEDSLQAEIGHEQVTSNLLSSTVKKLMENPPEPFDLARKIQVFSSKFQYVEHELRGAGLIKKEMTLSNVVLDPDAPENLRNLLQTHILPYSDMKDVPITVPLFVQGQIAYNDKGDPIEIPMTQSELHATWKTLIDQYLVKLPGFGWLIRKRDKVQFLSSTQAFEEVLKTWSIGFYENAQTKEKDISDNIIELVKQRARAAKVDLNEDIEERIREGVQRLKVTEPSIKVIFKDVAWESTDDREFTDALERSLPEEDLKGWFETFVAARKSGDGIAL